MPPLHRQSKIILPVVLILGFLITFGAFAEKVEAHKLFGFDFKVIRYVQSKIDQQHTRWMKAFTFLGSPIVVSIFVVSVAAAIFRSGKRREALMMLTANAAGAGFNEILKLIFRRKRPDLHRLTRAHGYSFPSGHSMGAVMFYGTFSYLVCRWTKSVFAEILSVIASTFMIFMTGISRIYLGVHYPSDVIAGFTAGGAWLSACLSAMDVLLKRSR